MFSLAASDESVQHRVAGHSLLHEVALVTCQDFSPVAGGNAWPVQCGGRHVSLFT